MGTMHLYQKPYPAKFDFVSFPAGWHISEFTVFLSLLNLMVMILVQLGNTLVSMSCSWEKPISKMLCVCAYFLYL